MNLIFSCPNSNLKGGNLFLLFFINLVQKYPYIQDITNKKVKLMNENKNKLTEYIALMRPAFITVGVISLFINLLMLTMPLYMVQVFDRVITTQSTMTLLYLTIAAGGALCTASFLDMIRGSIMVEVGKVLDKRVGEAVFSQVFNSQDQLKGSGSRYLRDLAHLRQFISSPVVFSILDIPWVPIYLSAIFILHPMLGFVALGGAIILITIGIVNHAWTYQLITESNRKWMLGLKIAELTERKKEVVDAMGFFPSMKSRWESENHEALNTHSLVGNRLTKMSAISKFTRQFLQVLILGVGAYYVIDFDLSSGAMLASSILLSRGLQPIEQCIGSLKNILIAWETYRRLNNFMTVKMTRGSELQLPKPQGRLDVVKVSYAPCGSKLILKDVSFALVPGEMLIIVGPSGSGKSTLARVIMGICKPLNGIVRLDSADVFNWDRTHFGQSVGYLSQEVDLFPGSVAENIARMAVLQNKNTGLSNEEHIDRDIVMAAKFAGVHEMILRLSKGYQTQVGEDGCNLSGGQRQGIGFARALYVKPKVLVLDEPDANLDVEGQKNLKQALKAIKSFGTTIILISHQQRYMAIADKVLILNNGVVEKFAAAEEFFPRQGSPKSYKTAIGSKHSNTANKKMG